MSTTASTIMLSLVIAASCTVSQSDAFQLFSFGAARSHDDGGVTLSSPQQQHLRRRRRREFIEIPIEEQQSQYSAGEWLEQEIRFLEMMNSLSMSIMSGGDEVCDCCRHV